MKQRFDELDSLRGLAAIIVMNTHILLSFPAFWNPTSTSNETFLVQMLKYTPLHLLWAGHASVIFFFLLSGFVLALPFLEGKSSPFLSYLVKRISRIYAPYLTILAIAFLCYYCFDQTAPVHSLSSWFNSLWYTEPDQLLVLHHLILIGNFNTEAYLYTIWSLVHEMRISLIFPLVMLLVIRYAYRVNISISLLLLVISPILTYILTHAAGLEPIQFSSYVATIHYTAIFLLGAITAKYRGVLIQRIKAVSSGVKVMLFSAAILSFTYEYWFFSDIHALHPRLFNDIFITIGSLIFLLLGLGSHAFSRFLLLKPVHYVGKISYSLYLFHPIALLTSVKLLQGYIPFWIIFMLAFSLSIAGAAVLHRLVEIPSIRLGKNLAAALLLVSSKTKRTKGAVL
jgi:peptidoglycan/LPS O-acetylase OafA/YrhL